MGALPPGCNWTIKQFYTVTSVQWGLCESSKDLSTNSLNGTDIVEITADLVAAYVANNLVASAALPGLIGQIHAAFQRLAAGGSAAEESKPPLVPAVPIRKSVTPDYVICLEDGRKFKALKRHLLSEYNMTPDEYREKWGLPNDYPMVAPNHAALRSALAKSIGLGHRNQAERKAK